MEAFHKIWISKRGRRELHVHIKWMHTIWEKLNLKKNFNNVKKLSTSGRGLRTRRNNWRNKKNVSLWFLLWSWLLLSSCVFVLGLFAFVLCGVLFVCSVYFLLQLIEWYVALLCVREKNRKNVCYLFITCNIYVLCNVLYFLLLYYVRQDILL
jgi:hypothetical protein